jgi:hypothetical protein
MKNGFQMLLLLVVVCFFAACASASRHADADPYDTTQIIVLDCSDGWDRCNSEANKICGPRGFDEVDRMQDTRMVTRGGLEDQGEGRHVYRDDLRLESQNEIMSIRCK